MAEHSVVSEGPAVVHQLDQMSATCKGPLLVVGYGSPMKAVVKTCAKLGCAPLWVTGTDDKERAFSCSGAASVASVGAVFDERLFANEYAIIEAAQHCGAVALLVCDAAVAESQLLLKAAHLANMRVFVPMEKDRTRLLWVERTYDGSLGQEPISWRKCPQCKLQHNEVAVLADHGICPTCGELYRLTSDERIAETFDVNTFEEWDTGLVETDPLGFPNYEGLIDSMRTRSGLEEAVRCGHALLDGRDVAFCIMEATFMMGSMGSVVGEKITRTVERATDLGLPLFIFTASGGARMQEGLVSLMQMGKISAAIERHSRAGLLYVSVITDPTTGGVTASFAMQGDIIVSEPHALIGFAGRRVIQDTIKQTLPDGFQTAEFALEHGLIDAIVARPELPNYLSELLALHGVPVKSTATANEGEAPDAAMSVVAQVARAAADSAAAQKAVVAKRRSAFDNVAASVWDALSPLTKVAGVVTERIEGSGSVSLKRALNKRGMADAPSVKPMTQKAEVQTENLAWESVLLARNVHRPTAAHYINAMVDNFLELHGDRMFADDGAIVGGIGWLNGQAVTVVAEEKGANLNQRIARNFECPQPEGYRKSLRLMRQAEKFGRPIVCLVDTQGAFCGMEAEERGQGNAIADNLYAMAGLTVPVVCVVLGEGGSGGALALAMGNRVAMQDHAVYSVLSPEGFASILWKDRTRAAEAAAVMKMSAREAYELGLIEEVLSEGRGPAHENPDEAAANVREFVVRSLDELSALSPDELRDQRYARFRAF